MLALMETALVASGVPTAHGYRHASRRLDRQCGGLPTVNEDIFWVDHGMQMDIVTVIL